MFSQHSNYADQNVSQQTLKAALGYGLDGLTPTLTANDGCIALNIPNGELYYAGENIWKPVGGGGASLSLDVFGSSPNANAATLASNILSLQPASLSFPGGVSTIAQTYAGSKSFANGIRTNSIDSYTASPLVIGGIAPFPTVINFSSRDISNFRGGVLDVVSIGNNMGLAGSGSVFIGQNAGELNTAAGTITIGDHAGSLNTNRQIIAIGLNALRNSTGLFCTAVGINCLASNTTGTDNTAFGIESLFSCVNGISNVAIGSRSLRNTIGNPGGPGGDGSYNVAVGVDTLFSNIRGYHNTAIGDSAMFSNDGGFQNVSVGRNSLYSNTSGNKSVAVGYESLNRNITGINNVALGHRSMVFNESGSRNVSVGTSALQSIFDTDDNTAIGHSALDNHTGSECTGVGSFCMSGGGLGTKNTALGASAMLNNGGNGIATTLNTAIGYESLLNNFDGNYNTTVGYQSGNNYTSNESDNLILGSRGVLGDNNVIRIGINDGSARAHTKNFQAGIRGVTTGLNDALTVLVDSAGQLGVISSSRVLKENISLMDDVKDIIARLRPSRFSLKSDLDHKLTYGLIAEECKEVVPDIVVPYDTEGHETIQYHLLPIILLKEIQRLQQLTDSQETIINEILLKYPLNT